MGLLDKLKLQLLKVIEWTDSSSDTLVYRFEIPDRKAIMKGSQLTVRESQMAVFVVEGKIADVFGPGRHKLEEAKNIPILTSIFSWKYAFETPYTGEVYFVNTKQFTAMRWGTTNPIMMRDKDFGLIRLRGYGSYAFRVKDPSKLLKELFGTRSTFKTEDIKDHLRMNIISRITDTIAESQVPALDLAMKYDELSEAVSNKLSTDFDQLGLELTSLFIENLSLPEEVEKHLDTRTNLGILGDKMGQYTQYQAANAMRDAAKNEGGNFASAGVGLGAGLGIGGMFTNAFNQSMQESKKEEKVEKEESAVCSKCGKEIPKGNKFCPHCGEKAISSKECPSCHVSVLNNAKFCPNCGANLSERKCIKCGALIKANQKFCPECGTKND